MTTLTSGASIAPAASEAIQPVRHEMPREPLPVRTVEEAQSVLQSMGASGQRMEQTISGDWIVACNVGQKQYEARSRDQFDSVRAVVEQVHRDR